MEQEPPIDFDQNQALNPEGENPNADDDQNQVPEAPLPQPDHQRILYVPVGPHGQRIRETVRLARSTIYNWHHNGR